MLRGSLLRGVVKCARCSSRCRCGRSCVRRAAGTVAGGSCPAPLMSVTSCNHCTKLYSSAVEGPHQNQPAPALESSLQRPLLPTHFQLAGPSRATQLEPSQRPCLPLGPQVPSPLTCKPVCTPAPQAGAQPAQSAHFMTTITPSSWASARVCCRSVSAGAPAWGEQRANMLVREGGRVHAGARHLGWVEQGVEGRLMPSNTRRHGQHRLTAATPTA